MSEILKDRCNLIVLFPIVIISVIIIANIWVAIDKIETRRSMEWLRATYSMIYYYDGEDEYEE